MLRLLVPRRATAAVALLWLLPVAGCGARSELEPRGLGTPASSTACEAAVEAGAAAPMIGLCSTRAFRSAFEAPKAPHLTWMTPAVPGNDGAMTAIDAAGTAYIVTGDTNGIMTDVVRVDPMGPSTIIARIPGSEHGNPILGADGNLRFVNVTGATFEIAIVTPEGSVLPSMPLPGAPNTTAEVLTDLNPLVGMDGSLYLVALSGNAEQLVKLAPDGTQGWSVAHMGGALSVALGPGDEVITVADAPMGAEDIVVVEALDPATGAMQWSQTLPGAVGAGPAVRPDGGVIVLVLDNVGNGVVSLLSPIDGSVQWSTRTGNLSFQPLWLGVDRDGAVAICSVPADDSPAVTVVDAGGAIRWQKMAPDAEGLGAIDSAGVLVLNSLGGAFALDMATGETRWTLTVPTAACLTDMMVSTGRVVYAIDCRGNVFAASDF